MNAENMRSDIARDMTHSVVGWDLSLERLKARMVKLLASTPSTQMMMAKIAPMIEVVSLNNN